MGMIAMETGRSICKIETILKVYGAPPARLPRRAPQNEQTAHSLE